MTSNNSPGNPSPKAPKRSYSMLTRIALGFAGLIAGLAIIGILIVSFMLALAYPNLPTLDSLTDYRPKIPLRIFSADNVLIGEFGEERRNLVHIKDVPDIMKKAVLAIEDDRFYEHGGVDYWGILRATLHNLTGGAKQGASTITQQVARNFFLSSEQTLKRKVYEILLAWKIEQNLSKDQILEVYMNQIYLGQRAYGFSSAAQIYFGTKLPQITIAEAAMLAGLPKAPSAYNPVVNPKRAKARQQYILQRMQQLGYITDAQYAKAKDEELKIKTDSNEFGVHAEYVAEMTRQLVYEQFKEDAYTRGLNVFTTITKADQDAAYIALRRGVMDYEKRHGYRGPEGYMDIPSAKEEAEECDRSRTGRPFRQRRHRRRRGTGSIAQTNPRGIGIRRRNHDQRRRLELGRQRTKRQGVAQSARQTRRHHSRHARRPEPGPSRKCPEVESAFVAANTDDGAIRALVGGFDYNRNKFNHVTQAWRQPGSSFKPFIYSASLEKGLSPATIINDAPITFRRRTNRRPSLGAEKLRQQVRRPDDDAQGSDQIEEHDFDPHPEQDRRQVRTGIHDPVRLRCRQESALPDAGARRRGGDAAADGRRLCGIRQRRLQD